MRRAVVPLALVLALVSGVVLAEARLVVLAPIVDRDADPRIHANDALIRRFYAMVDDALASGEVTSLSGIIGQDFVDHAPRPGVTPDRAGFVRSVQSLHLVDPALRLTVHEVLAQGDRVAVRIGIIGGEDGTFLGQPIGKGRLWNAVEMFRIEEGRIVEHWGEAATLALFEPLLGVTVPVGRPTRLALTLERWTYAPDAGETRATDLGFLVVLVDAGTLTITLDTNPNGAAWLTPRGGGGVASDGRPVAPGETATLAPGDAIVVPKGERFAVRNNGSVSAVALVVVAAAPTSQSAAEAGPGPTSATAGIVHTVVAGGPTATLPAGRATVAIGRAALAADNEILPHRVAAVELVAVEVGALAVTADGGAAWVTSPIEGTHRADGGTVPTGGGALVDGGTTVGYGAAGNAPLGLLIVTVDALAAGPATDAPGTPTS
jgi:predicted SnoaL-like aldol condensation-catalyzing enzyme